MLNKSLQLKIANIKILNKKIANKKIANDLHAFTKRSTTRTVNTKVAVVKELGQRPEYETLFSDRAGDLYLKAGSNLKASRFFAEIRALRGAGAHVKTVLVGNRNSIVLVITDKKIPGLTERLSKQLSMTGIKKIKIYVLKNY